MNERYKHYLKHLTPCCTIGSLWQPNIMAHLTAVDGKSTLAVDFRPDALCEEYMVIVSCSTIPRNEHTYKVGDIM